MGQPKVTRAQLAEQVQCIYYYRTPHVGHTVAMIVYKNGCSVVGEAREIDDPVGFKKDLGGQAAFEDALAKSPDILEWWDKRHGH